MSLIIKGMEMPKSCQPCKLKRFVGNRVLIGYKPEALYECPFCDGLFALSNQRQPSCKFEQLPTPHGRLIDEDQAQKNIENFVRGWCQDTKNDFNKYRDFAGVFIAMIKQAPTIIEAEGEQSE